MTLLEFLRRSPKLMMLPKKRSSKWRNVDFCKTQLVALWETISSFLDRVDLERVRRVDSKYLTINLHLNTENDEFLSKLGKFSEDAKCLISQFEEIHAEASSVHLNFRDSTTNQMQHVVLDLQIIRRQFRRYTSKVRNALNSLLIGFKSIKEPLSHAFWSPE